VSTEHGSADDSPTAVTNQVMDIVVGALILALASVFMFDSLRIGVGWEEGQGPAAGFFPFWISLMMALASLVNIGRAALALEPDGADAFVTRTAIGRVILVMLPTLGYVGLIHVLGIYVASVVFIIGFMLASKEGLLRSIVVGLGVPLALFMMFEKWFMVPLPKGPLEQLLGLG
jgi:putative tricarboxylic transport membrane protein